MREPKIDRNELQQMLGKGKSVKECAEHFSVSPAAVSKAKKQLGLIVAKDVQLESAHRFVNEHLDTVAQLRKLNENAHELLDLCMRWIKGDPEAIQVLESQVRKVRVGQSEESVTEYKFKDPREIALKAMAEIRGQLKLQNETLAMLAEMSAVYEFQQELINMLKEIDPEARDEFCRRIDERQAIRRAVRVTGEGN
jgi:hypothetical protein